VVDGPPVGVSAAEEFAAAWGVTLVERASSGHNEVWFARRGDEHVVLKVGDVESRAREAAALAAYPDAAARLLAFDATGALLVERVLLGDDLLPLSRTDDDAATAVVGRLIRELHTTQTRPEVHALPSLATLGSVFVSVQPDRRLEPELVDRARALFAELVADADEVVLHGDLHHMNVLRHGVGDAKDRWRAIDPHGWVGDPCFDTAALMANPRGLGDPLAETRHVSSLQRVERRIAILAETTGFAPERIRAWAYTGAVIAELWMLEDHGLVHGAPLALAEALAPTL